MKKTVYTGLLFGVLLVAMTASASSTPPASPERPNIVLIFMDDLGWKDLSCTGSTFYKTPNIDRLAAQGVRFTRAYSAAPLCAPSRGAVVTGKCPARTKYTSIMGNAPDDSLYTQSKALGLGNQNLEARHRHAVPSTETLFAERFKEAGYRTCFIGKWHCSRQPGYHPKDRGYDEIYAVRKAGGYPYYLTQEQIDSMEGLPGAKPGDYLPELMTQWACDFMARSVKKERPFLLHLCHFLVHGPITAKKDLVAEYTERSKTIKTDQDNVAYATMVQAMDDSVGMVMDQLEKLGQLENTLIIFTSDNGGLTLRETTSNYPRMGGKSFSYEGGYRVPFIAQWKGQIQPGQINDTRVIGTDIYPTFLDAAGLPLNPQQHADGMSLMGEFTQATKGPLLPQRALYFHHPHYTHASSPHSIILDGKYKLIRYYNDAEGGYALFDLEQDPNEQNDLCTSNPEVVSRLAKKLNEYLLEVDAELPVPADSEEGQRTLALAALHKNKGWNEGYKDHTNVMNKKTERELAMQERKIQERKITEGKKLKQPPHQTDRH
jgi:arylsulfatase A-like enzyme